VALGDENVRHRRLLPLIEVDAGRVVADGLKHHDGAGFRCLKGFHHAVEINRSVGAIPIGIGCRLEPRPLEQAVVVLPSRVADEHRAAGAVLGQEVGCDAHGPRAADGLDRCDALVCESRMSRTEDELLHAFAIERMSLHREVGPLRKAETFISGSYRAQHRKAAILVRIDTDAEIDLPVTRIGLEAVIEGEDRVARKGLDLSKQGFRHADLQACRGSFPRTVCHVLPDLASDEASRQGSFWKPGCKSRN
jgi:hypothetical protein